MQAITFLREVERLQKPVVLLSDVARIIGKGRSYAKVYVHRLVRRKLLHEVERGKYAISDDPLEIGSNLIFPSYVSFLSAYSVYNMTTQIPQAVQVVSPRSKKAVSAAGTKIIFVKFKKENIFGYGKQKLKQKYVFIAEPEKAVVDSLYLPEQCPLSESYRALGEKLDVEKLRSYALCMGSGTVVKRLGYLLELHGTDIHPLLKGSITKKYDALNPLLPKSKERSRKWRLGINEVLE
ncbi:hypothetical protein HYX10_06595 [Candidatus Woesearchaeota archaeon]|nr:hypothetical protein [Candidatus Woesearchaeota archaeon]